jgi:hypothetical protein
MTARSERGSELTAEDQRLFDSLSENRQAKARRLLVAVNAEEDKRQRAVLRQTLSKRLRKWTAAADSSDGSLPASPHAAAAPSTLPLLARPLGPRSGASLVINASDPDEQLRRAQRESRFAGEDDALGVAGGPPLRLVGYGTSTALEKPFLRLTSAPHASSVRPPEVLRRALAHVKQRWRAQPDYGWAGEQLQSIRQDLTVQHVRDALAVDTYETHARVALEMGDMPQFTQCLSVLRSLHAACPGAGSPPEFAAYRLLFAAAVGTDALAAELRRLSDDELRHQWVRHAMAAAAAMHRGDAATFGHMFDNAPRMSPYLMDALLPRVRAKGLVAALTAYRPGCPLSCLARQLGFTDVGQQQALLDWALATGAARVPSADGEVSLTSASRVRTPQGTPAVAKRRDNAKRRRTT